MAGLFSIELSKSNLKHKAMNIILKRLELENFKGIRHLVVDVDDKETFIMAANGKGKTSVMDANLWLLFDKDSTDRTTFEAKTLDEFNRPIHRLEHSVTATYEINGRQLVIRKVYKEKWTTKRGSPTPELTGHVKEYYWDGVPCNETEYKAKISNLINETQFKLISNLAYFNNVLKWEDRRALLLQLGGGMTDIDYARELNTQGQYQHIIDELMSNKSLDEYRKMLANQKKTIREKAEGLPYRINEAKRSLPEDADYAALELELEELKQNLQSVDEMLQSKSASETKRQEALSELVKKQGAIQRAITERKQQIENDSQDQKLLRERAIAEMKRRISTAENDRDMMQRDLKLSGDQVARIKGLIESLESERAKSVEEWKRVNADVFKFNDSECICPTCSQQLPDDNIEAKKTELENKFNTTKAAKLDTITKHGFKIKEQIENYNVELGAMQAKVSNIEAKIQTANSELNLMKDGLANLEEDNLLKTADSKIAIEAALQNDSEIKRLRAELEAINEELVAPTDIQDNSEFKARKKELQSKIDEVNIQLSKKDLKDKALARIAELEADESKFAQEVADIEQLEFSLIEFDREKMNLLEKKINGRFGLVTFKLFEEQINGGIKPTCVTLINGVPFPDANTASKVNASIDIINVFSEYFGIKAPVFIDNRESVTDLIENDLQIINLVVSPKHKSLTVVKSLEGEMAEA